MRGLPSLRALDEEAAGGPRVRLWLASEATDMRCGFDRLAERVRAVIGQDPLERPWVHFSLAAGRSLKDSDLGSRWIYFVVQTIGGGSFQAAPHGEGRRGRVELRASELAMILDGIDVSRLKRVRRYERPVG